MQVSYYSFGAYDFVNTHDTLSLKFVVNGLSDYYQYYSDFVFCQKEIIACGEESFRSFKFLFTAL